MDAFTPTPTPVKAPILLVDDDEGMREALRPLLQSEGYAVAEAVATAAALVHLTTATTGHVVLLDWAMLDYTRVLRAVEQDAALRRHMYVLFTDAPSVWCSFDDQPLIAAHCTEIIMQPFALEVTAVLEAIERAAAQLPIIPSNPSNP